MTAWRAPIGLALYLLGVSLALNLFLFGSFNGLVAAVDVFYDSAGYRALGEALLDGAPLPAGRLAQRGYLYPALAVFLDRQAPWLLFVVQAMAVAAAGGLLAACERKLAGRVLATPLVFASVSLMLAPAYMMTEAFALLLGAVAMAFFVLSERVRWGLVFLVLAALVKPAFYPVAGIAFLLMLARVPGLWAALVLGALALGPQLYLTWQSGGQARLSTAGGDNFSNRFYPAVAGMVETGEITYYKAAQAASYKTDRPGRGEQVRYVLGHPVAAVRTWTTLLVKDHFATGSGYAVRTNTAAKLEVRWVLWRLSRWGNWLLVALLLPAAWGMWRYLRANGRERWPAALVVPTLLASAPLVYWQGDRVVFPALVMALPFAGHGLRTWFEIARGPVSGAN